MRKVLLRIIFEDAWSWQSVGNEMLVGYGWAATIWVVLAVISIAIMAFISKNKTNAISSLVFWCAIPAVLCVVPFTSLPIAEKGIPLFGYGMMLFVGFSSATWLAARRAASVGIEPEVIWDMIMWLLIPGIVGARIVYLMQYGHLVFDGKSGAQLIIAAIALWDGGIVFYGCVIGGSVGLYLYSRKRKIQLLTLADVVAPSLFVGLGFGRIGCFLYGCCYGSSCSQPWAVQFPADSMTFGRFLDRSKQTGEKLFDANGILVDAQQLATLPPETAVTTLPLHPAQLYSSGLAFLLAGLLMWFFRRRPFTGSVIALACILYPVNRFVLEIIRNDEPGRMGTGLTFSQWLSIGLCITGCVLMWWLNKTHTQTAGTKPISPTS